MKLINEFDKWLILKDAFIEKGYKPWSYQYSASQEEGLHVWFWKSNRTDIEVVTHNKEIEKDIIRTSWKNF